MNQDGYKNVTEDAQNTPVKDFHDTSKDWSVDYITDGTGSSEYHVVAVYSYTYDGGGVNGNVHNYLFTIKNDGTPAVLYSSFNQGGVYFVKETDNEDLKNGFSDIVND